MILPILKMGHPTLLQVAKPVEQHEFGTPALLSLIEDMRETQHAANGIGIAAPQIGISKRLVVIEFPEGVNPRYGDMPAQKLTVIINPELEFISDEVSDFAEGCLSVPGLRGIVTRPKALRYKYYDQYGILHHGENEGLFARVLQHECDHLDGILYPMRMDDISKLGFIDAIPSETPLDDSNT